MNTQRVENMTSSNGNKIANQFIISTYGDNGELIRQVFQSYDSTIASREGYNGQVTLDKGYWDYSKTTSKYRNIFLNETTQETKKKIADGTYLLSSLN